MDDTETFFKKFRYPSCDTSIKHADHFNLHVKCGVERVKHFHPQSVYTLRVKLFDKLEETGTPYNDEQKFFKNLAISDIEYICVPTEELKKQTQLLALGNLNANTFVFHPILLTNMCFYATKILRR